MCQQNPVSADSWPCSSSKWKAAGYISNFTLARSAWAIFMLAIKALAAGFSCRAKSRQFRRFNCIVLFEPQLGDEIRFVALARGNIGKDLLVEEFERAVLNIGSHFRKKQLHESQEEGRNQLF